MREYVWLECTGCGDRNYRVQKETGERTGSSSRSIVDASGSTIAASIEAEVVR